MGRISIKRVYEPVEKSDGMRILVDRLWPRGLKKDAAHLDLWMKAVAPSVTLRKWFDHDPEKWQEFSLKYRFELKNNPAVPELLTFVKQRTNVTLLYAARDEQHNHALVLQKHINDEGG
jgi:uncharacterized protein YeaO (DUF488 family)